MNAISFKGGHPGHFKLNKDEKESKKAVDQFSPIIDKVIEEALSQSFSSSFIESFMEKLFNDESNLFESVRCAYLSTSTFQPTKFYDQLKSLLAERNERKNVRFYDSRPTLNEVLSDVKKEKNEFIGIFNISETFDKKFFKKFVDLLMERSQNAVLIFVTMFNLGEESSLGFLGIPAYTSSIYDQKNFVQLVQNGLAKTPLPPKEITLELDLYKKFHRSDRILARRLKLQLIKSYNKKFNYKEQYPPQNVIDNLDEPELEDYKLVFEMIFDIAHERRPILYHEVLERFSAVKGKDIPKYLKKYSVQYYFRVILDSLAYCGIIERKADNPELIKFIPTPSYNLIKKQINNCVMD